jgi:hypothetical protein
LKLKTLVLTFLFVAGVAASVAVAKGPPPGKGKGKDDGAAASTGSTSTGTTTTSERGKGKGKGKDKKKDGEAAECKPTVTFVLKGEFVSGGASSLTGGSNTGPTDLAATGPAILGTFEMKVSQANSHGTQYVGKTVTVSFNKKTKFRRRGHAEIEDYEAGDRLNVHVRGCKTSTSVDDSGSATGTTTTPNPGSATATKNLLLAKQVIGKPKKGADSSTTTTDTTTTTPTTP